ncbi:MAG: matrixin family metalloprotease, partial [Bradymonadaceae bacterium]
DLLYNGVKYNWNTSGNISSASLDVEVVTTHEAGHLLGLRHSSNSDATMYAQLQSISQRSLHQDDKNGVCYLYPKGEKCNGRDDNCDGQVDEGNLVQNCDKQQGVCQGAQVSCSNGSYPSCGGAEYGSDYEQQESSCDGKDNDCDGSVDEELTRDCSLQQGVCEGASVTCSSGSYPNCGAAEYGSDYEQQESSCDGKDNDCDGSVDEMLRQTYWRDDDQDGFGTPGETTEACSPAPDGYVDNDGDCAPSDSDEPGADGNCTVDTGIADTTTADTGKPASDVSDRDTATRDTGVLDTTTADTTDRPASPDTESTAGSDLSAQRDLVDRRSEGGCSCSASPNSTAPWLPLQLFVLAVAGLRARTRRDR